MQPRVTDTFLRFYFAENAALFFHPDFTVGSGISENEMNFISVFEWPDRPECFLKDFSSQKAPRFADCTAGGELHPAPKNLFLFYFRIISYCLLLFKSFISGLIGHSCEPPLPQAYLFQPVLLKIQNGLFLQLNNEKPGSSCGIPSSTMYRKFKKENLHFPSVTMLL